MYGAFTQGMIDATKPFVKGKALIDLGSGSGSKGEKLMLHGKAASLTSVDKESFPEHKANQVQAYFKQIVDRTVKVPEYDVALIAWPQNYPNVGLIELLKRAETFIYLGCNYGGSACGDAPPMTMQLHQNAH